jgi:hypothetical protein
MLRRIISALRSALGFTFWLADETEVKKWAGARLWGQHYPIPDRAIGNWLRALTINDAGLVAQADGFGMLRAHLSGAALFPGLPPVGSFDDTVRWRVRHQPRPVHVARAKVEPSPGARDPFEVISEMERAY